MSPPLSLFGVFRMNRSASGQRKTFEDQPGEWLKSELPDRFEEGCVEDAESRGFPQNSDHAYNVSVKRRTSMRRVALTSRV